MDYIPVVATLFSVLSRIVFMYLIYTNKSKNSISLLFSICSIISGSLWLFIFIDSDNMLLIIRTSVELMTSIFSSMYIIKNKLD